MNITKQRKRRQRYYVSTQTIRRLIQGLRLHAAQSTDDGHYIVFLRPAPVNEVDLTLQDPPSGHKIISLPA